MIRGLYTAALGMTTQMKRMDVISDNMANVNTTGFKKDMVVTSSFSKELMKRLDDKEDIQHSVPVGDVSQGVFVDDVRTDFTSGSLKQTDGSLDIAISGKGFFNIKANDAQGNEANYLSRDGSFTLSSNGTLMTKEGNKVMGENGTIIIPDGTVTIDEKGNIYSNDEFIDKIKMSDIENPESLRKYKDNLYSTTDSNITEFNGKLEQGFLENSNVNSVKEMVDMITVNRAYEASQKIISIQDGTLAKAVSEIGRK